MDETVIERKWDELWLSPTQFLQRAEILMQQAELASNSVLLIYSALETRLCIERLFSHYLFVISNGKLSMKMQKDWQAKTMKASILQLQPDFS